MQPRFTLTAYWNARPESLDECAEKAHRLFVALAEADPLLGQWYRLGHSRKDALKRKIEAQDLGVLRALLARGQIRTDIGRQVMKELGFGIWLWNGAADEAQEASVNARCGAHGEHGSGNCVIVDFPRDPSSGWVENAHALLARVAEIWLPDWAGVASDHARQERAFDASEPFVDWLVFVPWDVGSVPAPAKVERLGRLGSIVAVQPNPPVRYTPGDLAHIRSVERSLGL